MTIHSVGDQARAFVLQSQAGRLRKTLQVLTGELSSGTVADPAGRLGGNTGLLHHYESQITLLAQFQQSGSEAAAMAKATQDALSTLHAEAADFTASLLSLGSVATMNFLPLRAAEARSLFTSAVGRLNIEVAGLHLFSGQASDQPPLIAPEAILSALETLTAGMTTAVDVEAAITGWFDAPAGAGGYLDIAYRGTIDQPRVAQIAADRNLTFDTSAATPAIRQLLAGLAIAALADAGTLTVSDAERLQLMRRAGPALLSGSPALLDEMGRIGLVESLAERFGTEHANALAVAQTGRAQLVSADPFQTATALHEVETQMQTLYTLTARLSRLKLVDYLR